MAHGFTSLWSAGHGADFIADRHRVGLGESVVKNFLLQSIEFFLEFGLIVALVANRLCDGLSNFFSDGMLVAKLLPGRWLALQGERDRWADTL